MSSDRIRRVKIRDQVFYTLGVKTLPLDEVYFNDPIALAESNQLFRLGVLLIEIALGISVFSDVAEAEEPFLRALEKLPLVCAAVGSTYCEACAFCIQDRRLTSHYGHPDKYRFAEETGWDVYLRDLVHGYHESVVLR